MCGRVTVITDEEFKKAVKEIFGKNDVKIEKLEPHYNIAPSQPLPTLLNM